MIEGKILKIIKEYILGMKTETHMKEKMKNNAFSFNFHFFFKRIFKL